MAMITQTLYTIATSIVSGLGQNEFGIRERAQELRAPSYRRRTHTLHQMHGFLATNKTKGNMVDEADDQENNKNTKM